MTSPYVSVCYRPGAFVLPLQFTGKIPEGRLASTPGDNLVELSAKCCYDTFNVRSDGGRPSAEYHQHVLSQGHGSVAAHIVETFQFHPHDVKAGFELLAVLAGRPGVWITEVSQDKIRFCLSLRAVLEWAQHGVYADSSLDVLTDIVVALGHRYPLTLAGVAPQNVTLQNRRIKRVDPVHPTEKWVSLYIEGISRDLLQELARHHYQTNPSVRSTRYVDEGESNSILHPAITDSAISDVVDLQARSARSLYQLIFRMLTTKGVDKKTARGAARSVLPGATETRLVYSLSEFQAKHILALRADQSTGSADPEIVRLAGMMRTVLRAEGWDV